MSETLSLAEARRRMKGSAEERMNELTARLARLDQRLESLSDTVATDTARVPASTPGNAGACVGALELSIKDRGAVRARVRLLEGVLPAFNVLPDPADFAWARRHVEEMGSILRSVPRGAMRVEGIVAAIRALKATAEAEAAVEAAAVTEAAVRN